MLTGSLGTLLKSFKFTASARTVVLVFTVNAPE